MLLSVTDVGAPIDDDASALSAYTYDQDQDGKSESPQLRRRDHRANTSCTDMDLSAFDELDDVPQEEDGEVVKVLTTVEERGVEEDWGYSSDGMHPTVRVMAAPRGTTALTPSALAALEDATPPLSWMSWLAMGGGMDPDSLPLRIANDDLQEAALRGDLGLVRRLIFAGASVNAPMRPESEDEFMCLVHVLAHKPQMPNGTRIIAEIVNKKANLNARSSIGMTPLSCACLSAHVGAVEVLLEAKADPSPLDDRGCKAVRYAVLSSQDSNKPRAEALSVEIIQLLAKAETDMDEGGDVLPIIEAVRLQSIDIVQALLASGATADGMHDAIESSPISIVAELVRYEANPFLKDSTGRTCMDIALARGDEDITTMLRDFIGDLQRKQHKHLRYQDIPTDEEAIQEEQRWKLAKLSEPMHRKSTLYGACKTRTLFFDDSTWVLKAQYWSRRINKNKFFQAVMFYFLLLALFLPDIWILFNIVSSTWLDALLVVIVSAFLVEFAVQLIGLWRSYLWSFFFWMDLVGVLSVPLDHSMVTNALPSAFDNAVVMRTARMAKLGARAGRFTKLVKLLRFLPGMGVQQESAGTAKVISATLNMALSTRVSCLIILMVMILPLFELVTYPENDFSMRMWVNALSEAAIERPSGIGEVLSDFEAFYQEESYFPYEVHYVFQNESAQTVQLSQEAPARARSRVQIKASSGGSYAMFNFKGPHQVDALCNCLLIITIMILIIGSTLILSRSVSSIVLVPLEHLLGSVQRIAGTIFSSVAKMAGPKDKMEEEDVDGSESPADAMSNETQLLESVLKKLAALSEVAVKKSIDAETFEMLGESDRAVIQGYSNNVLDPQNKQGFEEIGSNSSDVDYPMQQGAEVIERRLLEVDIAWQDFNGWEFNVMELSEEAKKMVCFCVLTHHHSSVGSGNSPEWETCCKSFLDAVSAGYASPKQVPYHNWTHAVDVTFITHRMLTICSTEHFFGASERLALAVGSVSHDIGHLGVNNTFLVETSHELAIRYNDHSPLENMHCAKLFELTGQPNTRIFADLERGQYREVRQVCVEAILHTDYQHHFVMVKDIQNLYEMNSDLFDASENMYKNASAEYPAKEVADFFRAVDVKKNLRVIFLHFCDVSNSMKPFYLCEPWANMAIEEFFLQGDREKELGFPVQPLNDREKVNKPYSQVGFIEFYVAPMALAMARLIPPLNFCMDLLLDNSELWFDRWVSGTEPPPELEEQVRIKERIVKLEEKYHKTG